MTLLRRIAATALAAAAGVGCLAATTTAQAAPAPATTVHPATAFANDKAAFDFFVAEGLTKRQAAAIVGNFGQESSVDPLSGKGTGHVGIGQWTADLRWHSTHIDSMSYYTVNVRRGDVYTLKEQLYFTWYELTHFPVWGLAELRQTTTIDDAVQVFAAKFEVCICDMDKRRGYAHSVFNAYA